MPNIQCSAKLFYAMTSTKLVHDIMLRHLMRVASGGEIWVGPDWITQTRSTLVTPPKMKLGWASPDWGLVFKIDVESWVRLVCLRVCQIILTPWSTTLIILKFNGYKMHHFNYKSVDTAALFQLCMGFSFQVCALSWVPAPAAEVPKKLNIKELTQL